MNSQSMVISLGHYSNKGIPSLTFLPLQVGRRRLDWSTAAYHAGQTGAERARIQKRFMLGRLRVLFATSAFGMGVNKSDLQAVIHYSLTRSFENYIQVTIQVIVVCFFC